MITSLIAHVPTIRTHIPLEEIREVSRRFRREQTMRTLFVELKRMYTFLGRFRFRSYLNSIEGRLIMSRIRDFQSQVLPELRKVLDNEKLFTKTARMALLWTAMHQAIHLVNMIIHQVQLKPKVVNVSTRFVDDWSVKYSHTQNEIVYDWK